MTKFSLHKEGFLTLGLAVFFTVLAFFLLPPLGLCGIATSVLIIYFFRDPQRAVPLCEEFILSPADGVICKIETATPPKSSEIEGEMNKISIFLSPLDVHVNRIPVNGVVKNLHYVPGKKLRADYDSSEDENERQEIVIELSDGGKIVVVQQTGFLARRIVCDLKKEQKVSAGKRFGIIKFGSRVTVYLPKDMKILVTEQQTVIAGETVLGLLSDNKPEVTGHIID